MTSPLAGRPAPLGATVRDGGVNFSVYSRTATGLSLLLFGREDDRRAARVVPLDRVVNRTAGYWHVFVPGVEAGQIYGYRAHGPHEPSRGLRFDSAKVLLDPYARGVVVPAHYDREDAKVPGDNVATAMKAMVVDPKGYDWEGDAPLRRPASETIIYEMHVRGFTKHPSSGLEAEKRGTFAGVVEKIPYLRELGVTAVELLPVFAFDAQDCPPGLINYWGYAPISFFAPHVEYSSIKDPIAAVREFRDMVKALHKAGIEVILDVVFNHTAEVDEIGPTLSMRGLDNPTYYILDQDPAKYANYAGTGNVLKADEAVVRRLIVDSLKYWVEEMHVDGFRFDLASILTRDSSGAPIAHPAVVRDIETEPALAGTKLIAEAWDAAGLYQVGNFPGDSWMEWNGPFRDDVRGFLRGEEGLTRRFADRLLGSPDIFGHEEREAEQSVNFVTCHDGFSLNDMVSYDRKHNEANREDNRDGADDNRSWNCGHEGPTDDPVIEALRERMAKNALTVNMLSLGVPMILMGDEVRRTQLGNNNAYCQDNELSWFDWSLVSKHAGLLRFVSHLNERRLRRSKEAERKRLSLEGLLRRRERSWHGVRLEQPDWSHQSHTVVLEEELVEEGLKLQLIVNAFWQPLEFELPAAAWRRYIDTALPSPQDIVPWPKAPAVAGRTYRAEARSVVVLLAEV
ncbi:MAG: glycogen debranching protein GlgX [Planctomycetota bacterium]